MYRLNNMSEMVVVIHAYIVPSSWDADAKGLLEFRGLTITWTI